MKKVKYFVFIYLLLIFAQCKNTKSNKSIEVLHNDSISIIEGDLLSCSLSKDSSLSNSEFKELKKLPNLVELRVISQGGLPLSTYKRIGKLPQVKHFIAHYGLSREGVGILDNFPNLRKLELWGQPTPIDLLPKVLTLDSLNIEENNLSLGDINKIKVKFPNLREFRCDTELQEVELIQIKSLPNLKRIVTSSSEHTLEQGIWVKK